MQLHSFARYISSSILSSFGFMVVWKCFLSLSFFKFYGYFFFNFYFSIVNNLCRGSELCRDPWSSVCDVRLFLLLLRLLVGCRFSLRRSELVFSLPLLITRSLFNLKKFAYKFCEWREASFQRQRFFNTLVMKK